MTPWWRTSHRWAILLGRLLRRLVLLRSSLQGSLHCCPPTPLAGLSLITTAAPCPAPCCCHLLTDCRRSGERQLCVRAAS